MITLSAVRLSGLVDQTLAVKFLKIPEFDCAVIRSSGEVAAVWTHLQPVNTNTKRSTHE